jgi:ribosome recycling factor
MIISQERFLVKSGLASLALVNTLSAWRLKEKSLVSVGRAYIGVIVAINISGYRQKLPIDQICTLTIQ